MQLLKLHNWQWPLLIIYSLIWLGAGLGVIQALSARNPWAGMLVSILVFILPGAGLYAWIREEYNLTTRHITFGFVFSHLLIALFSFFARIIHWPFSAVQVLFWISGLLFGGVWLWHTSKSKWMSPNWGEVLAAGLVMILAAASTIPSVIDDDELAYLARIVSWQSVPGMNFNDVYFGENYLDGVRFWIMSAPFGEALLSNISGLHPLVMLSGYYDPFLAGLAILSLYQLARSFGLSITAASMTIAAQLAFLSLLWPDLHPGYVFFNQLNADKTIAAFIILPVFLQTLNDGFGKNRILFGLSIFSQSMMHPVLLAFSVSIAAGMILLGFEKQKWQKNLTLLCLLFFSLLPHVILRFLPSNAQADIPYDSGSLFSSRGIENVILTWGNSGMYGLNPESLAMTLPYSEKLPIPYPVQRWGWLILPIVAASLAWFRFRTDRLARLIISAFILAATAVFPFSGWILGAFVSAWMLERTTWVYPYGLGFTFLLVFLLKEKKYAQWTVYTGLTALVITSMLSRGLPDFERANRTLTRSRELAQIGYFLGQQMDVPGAVIGSDRINDFIPTLSWKAKVISYRPNDPSYPYFYSLLEREQRYKSRHGLFAQNLSPQEKISILRKYNVQYVVVEQSESKAIQQLLDAYSQNFFIHTIGRYFVIKFNQ